jgi:hypothetical protein
MKEQGKEGVATTWFHHPKKFVHNVIHIKNIPPTTTTTNTLTYAYT